MNDDYGPASKKEAVIITITVPLEKLVKWLKRLWRNK